MIYKVVFFGKNRSGKTQLNRRIAEKQYNFQEHSPPTVGVEFSSRSIDSNKRVGLWDTSGDERFKKINHKFYPGTDVGVFCVDLSEEINEQEIKESIQVFRQFAPNAPIICVGTKADLLDADRNKLDKIKSKELFVEFITTSAKEGYNIEELFSLISKYCESKLLSSWNEAVAKLSETIKELPNRKKILINNELTELSKVILVNSNDKSVTPRHKAKAIENFTHHCEAILEGEHPNVLKAVLSVAAAAVVLIVTALIGFAIGVACSWWTGPGAFFAGILSGYTAAVAVASSSTALGIVAGGITAHGLFKTSKEMSAIDEFTAQVSSFNTAIDL